LKALKIYFFSRRKAKDIQKWQKSPEALLFWPKKFQLCFCSPIFTMAGGEKAIKKSVGVSSGR